MGLDATTQSTPQCVAGSSEWFAASRFNLENSMNKFAILAVLFAISFAAVGCGPPASSSKAGTGAAPSTSEKAK